MWVCHGEVVSRTPAVDVREFISWSHSADHIADVDARMRSLALGLVERFRAGDLRSALAVASPSLCRRLDAFPAQPGDAELNEVVFQLAKYWTRICFRATPFGLFSAVGAVEDAPVRRFHVARLDAGVASRISEQLLKDVQVRKNLLYKANETAVLRGEVLSYIERRTANDKDMFKRVELDANPHLQKLVEVARHLKAFPEIVEALLPIDPDYDRESIEEYLLALSDEGLLISSLTPGAHDTAPEHVLLRALEGLDDHRYTVPLKTLARLIDQHDGSRPDQLPALIDEIGRLLKAEFDIDVDSCPLQVDSYCSETAPRIAAGNSRLVTQLEQLSRAATKTATGLDPFFNALREKFGNGDVPLLTALDEINGVQLQEVFYSTPLLDGLTLMPRQQSSGEQIDMKKLIRSAKKARVVDRQQEVEIDEKALSDLSRKTDNYADAFTFMVTVWQERQDSDPLYVIESFSPGFGMLGRFCHLDEVLASRVRDLAARHPDDGILRAEICFNPGGRVANVSLRPALFPFNIPLFSPENGGDESNLALDDLSILSIHGQRKLWSVRHDREVLPVLPNAHNYMGSKLPIYKFLSLAQHHGRGIFVGDSVSPAPEGDFAPQVRFKNLILRRRRWTLSLGDQDAKALKTMSQKVSHARTLATGAGLPRYVSVMWGDQQLMLDLDNPIYLALLSEEVVKKKQIQIEDGGILDGEKWLPPEQAASCVERLVSFTSTREPAKAATSSLAAGTADDALNVRHILPGGEWMYAKLYTKPHVIDELITGPLRKLVQEQLHGFEWHMVRYKDTDSHLRLRVRLPAPHMRQDVEPLLYRWFAMLQERTLIQRVQVDSYEQEIERYGGVSSVKLAERYFHLDSVCVMDLLATLPQNESARWMLGLASAYGVLLDFGLNTSECFEIVDRMRDGFGREFNDTPDLRKLLGKKYNTSKQDVARLLATSQLPEDLGALSLEPFLIARRNGAAELVAEFRCLADEDMLVTSLNEIIQSLVHMTLNRVFLINPREHELVVYDFLRRYLLAEQAKQKSARASAQAEPA